ncbi:MAG: thiamine-phosphate kinase [Candidatus Thiodiazotropha sp. 6PLUC2]
MAKVNMESYTANYRRQLPTDLMKIVRETTEFALINRYFKKLTNSREDVVLGIGDDAALLEVPDDMSLAVSMDTLVSGIHFFEQVAPESLGHKALAVNLSDLAAMGADPAWVTLSLTLPEVDETWVYEFCRGFAGLANQYGVQLIGGDTTRGPLSISVQVHGFVPQHLAMRRGGARVGDDIYVTGTLGDAAFALKQLKQSKSPSALAPLERLERPQPRVEAGLALRHLAHSAIDLSDGLLADLGHILSLSGVGATLQLETIPLSAEVASAMGLHRDWSLIVAGGDDYELCVTLPASDREEVAEIASGLGLFITRIGQIEKQQGLRCRDSNGDHWSPAHLGFDHFSS